MQFVSEKWYDWYSRTIVFISGALFVATVLKLFAFQIVGIEWGLSYLVLVLTFTHLVYGFFVHPIIRNRSTPFAATAISNFIFLAIIVSLLQTTGQLHSPY